MERRQASLTTIIPDILVMVSWPAIQEPSDDIAISAAHTVRLPAG
jgi:hypothetical protein